MFSHQFILYADVVSNLMKMWCRCGPSVSTSLLLFTWSDPFRIRLHCVYMRGNVCEYNFLKLPHLCIIYPTFLCMVFLLITTPFLLWTLLILLTWPSLRNWPFALLFKHKATPVMMHIQDALIKKTDKDRCVVVKSLCLGVSYFL